MSTVLTHNEGCAECSKSCRFNGLIVNPNANQPSEKFGCNSSKRKDKRR